MQRRLQPASGGVSPETSSAAFALGRSIIPYKRVHDAPITKDGPKRLHRHQKDGPRALHNDTWQMALLPNQSPCPPRYALARQRNKEAKLREHQRAEVELGLEAAAGDQAHDLGG